MYLYVGQCNAEKCYQISSCRFQASWQCIMQCICACIHAAKHARKKDQTLSALLPLFAIALASRGYLLKLTTSSPRMATSKHLHVAAGGTRYGCHVDI